MWVGPGKERRNDILRKIQIIVWIQKKNLKFNFLEKWPLIGHGCLTVNKDDSTTSIGH